MTNNAKKFLEAVSKDKALQEELNTATSQAVVELAAKHGFALTAEEFSPSEMIELTEDEQKAVAGGRLTLGLTDMSERTAYTDMSERTGCNCTHGGYGLVD